VKNVKRNFYRLHSKNSFRLFPLDLEILQSKLEKRQYKQDNYYVFREKNSKLPGKYRFQIGDRDHAVLHACKTVDNLVATDKQFKKFVEDIHKKLTL
jgi:chromosomal replication initiator protein